MVLKWSLTLILLSFPLLTGCGHKVELDEAKAAGKTVADFAPTTDDYFAKMDGSADPETGSFRPLSLDQQAIMGRNAWMLWTGGNEAFWDWLARHGYGTLDFLELLDSQQRKTRFARAGLISEPSMRPPSEEETRAAHGIRYDRPIDPKAPQPDWKVYGYSSGIVGLRLFPNPEFQGQKAASWDSDRYYKDADYAANPHTIRPFRVGMSCAFCHAGPHPLNPPVDPAAPEWENLSGTIGNQYMRTSAIFGNRLSRNNFLFQALSSQLPGTIDTSLIAADNINNASTMNAIFDLPQRVARSLNNPHEVVGHEVEGYPGIGKGSEAEIWNANPRPVPRVLADGSDSVGVYVALARVYLNIGTYHQQWIRLHNPILGIRKQQPFRLTDCEKNSVYWSATKARVEPIVSFFQQGTAPMRLKDAPDGKSKGGLQGAGVPWDPAYAEGRKIFARGCIACHSSIQPGDTDTVDSKITLADFPGPRVQFRLTTDDLWRLTQGDGELPAAYVAWAAAAVEQQEFWEQNFLSTDMRVPVTMTKTNAARAVGTNAKRGHVWSDFSSVTYKQLDSVGQISFRDPFSGTKKKFAPPSGDPAITAPIR